MEWTSRRKRLLRRIFVKYAVEISDLPLFSSRDVCKNEGYRIIGQKQRHLVNKCILFEITRMKSVNPRIAALFYASVMKVLKVRPVVRRKKKKFHRQIYEVLRRFLHYQQDEFKLKLAWKSCKIVYTSFWQNNPKTVARYYKRTLAGQLCGDWFRSQLAPCWHLLFVLPPVFLTHEVNEK